MTPVPAYDDLRPARQAKNITVTAAANHFNVWPGVISRIERGLQRDDQLGRSVPQLAHRCFVDREEGKRPSPGLSPREWSRLVLGLPDVRHVVGRCRAGR